MLRRSILVGISSLAIAATLLIAYARRPSLSLPDYKSQAAEQSTESRIEAELLVLRSDGFHPREIKRPRGKFLLAIQNHGSAEEPSLVLTREAGASLKQIRFSPRQSKYRELLDLPPGKYVLAEANHSDWTCQIIIEQ